MTDRQRDHELRRQLTAEQDRQTRALDRIEAALRRRRAVRGSA